MAGKLRPQPAVGVKILVEEEKGAESLNHDEKRDGLVAMPPPLTTPLLAELILRQQGQSVLGVTQLPSFVPQDEDRGEEFFCGSGAASSASSSHGTEEQREEDDGEYKYSFAYEDDLTGKMDSEQLGSQIELQIEDVGGKEVNKLLQER